MHNSYKYIRENVWNMPDGKNTKYDVRYLTVRYHKSDKTN
jgi:hypothetical protein